MAQYVVSFSFAATINSPTFISSISNSQERQERESNCPNMQSCIFKDKGHNIGCWQPTFLKKSVVGVREERKVKGEIHSKNLLLSYLSGH